MPPASRRQSPKDAADRGKAPTVADPQHSPGSGRMVADGTRTCAWCHGPIPDHARPGRVFCSEPCRNRSWRARNPGPVTRRVVTDREPDELDGVFEDVIPRHWHTDATWRFIVVGSGSAPAWESWDGCPPTCSRPDLFAGPLGIGYAPPARLIRLP